MYLPSFQMSERQPIPRSLTSFSQSKKFSEKYKPYPKPESEWSKHLTSPKQEIKCILNHFAPI